MFVFNLGLHASTLFSVQVFMPLSLSLSLFMPQSLSLSLGGGGAHPKKPKKSQKNPSPIYRFWCSDWYFLGFLGFFGIIWDYLGLFGIFWVFWDFLGLLGFFEFFDLKFQTP